MKSWHMPTITLNLFFFTIFLTGWLRPCSVYAIENKECFECHSEVDQEKFAQSIHGKHLCVSCHSDIKISPHEQTPGPVKCANCHRLEQQIYLNSDHGMAVTKGISEAASCKACHGDNHYLLNYRNAASPVNRSNINKTCAKCHNDEKKMEPYKLTQAKPYQTYLSSVHGKAFTAGNISAAVCTDCHGSHDLHSPNNPESRIYKFNVPGTCGKCHENVLQTFKMSVHAKALLAGIKDAPACIDCHGEHSILSHTDPTSSVNAASIVKTCSHCHASEKITTKYDLPVDVMPTYMQSYHGTAYQYGSTTVANCESCHGFHDILPSSDPRSSINPKNVGITCGKCHAGAGDQLAKGSVHVRPSPIRDRVIFYVSTIYIIMIVLIIGGMLGHNFLDFRKKIAMHFRQSAAAGVAVRMGKSERIQHIVLLVCFITLVYTGFAHKYPNSLISYPFIIGDIGPLVRKVLHRLAGIIFIGFMGYHGTWLIGTAYGRKKLIALLPRWRDVLDFIHFMRYNLGFISERPRFSRYSYMEKAEYWALIWGSFVMILTGLMLMFENLSLSFMSKWLIDVMLLIHFFEAILASLAILVWHFYWVIFDPQTYPMNWTWLTGKVTKHQLEERDENVEL